MPEIDNLIYEITANPPHEGHQTALRVASNELRPENSILVIPWTHVWKANAGLAPYEIRRRMAETQFRDVAQQIRSRGENFSIYQLPKSLKKGVQTHELIDVFTSEVGGQLGYLIGADNLARFHLRENWEKILEKAKVVVVPRNEMGYEETLEQTHGDVLAYIDNQRIVLIQPTSEVAQFALEASSTKVKDKLSSAQLSELTNIIVGQIHKRDAVPTEDEVLDLVTSYIHFAEVCEQLPEIDSEVLAIMITWQIFTALGI